MSRPTPPRHRRRISSAQVFGDPASLAIPRTMDVCRKANPVTFPEHYAQVHAQHSTRWDPWIARHVPSFDCEQNAPDSGPVDVLPDPRPPATWGDVMPSVADRSFGKDQPYLP